MQAVVFKHAEEIGKIKVNPYLEFDKQILTETHFHVMQEGHPTGFTVILS